MEIYLTFDDGIHAGTEEVLGVLRETGVRATFFLAGIETCNSFIKNPALCKKLLQDIFENHSVGNHSYSHAHYLFNKYYEENGVPVDDMGNRMSIVDDFEKCARVVGELKDRMMPGERATGGYMLSRFQKKPLARLPGRNTWCLKNPGFDEQNTRTILLYREANTASIAQRLNYKGYEVFGWDLEWKMNFDYQREAIDIINLRKEKGTYRFSEKDSVHPDFDMYAPGEELKDRLSESWQSCLARVMESGKTKVVFLMHDRAFRNSVYTTVNNDQDLRSFIMGLQQMNVVFKKLDEY